MDVNAYVERIEENFESRDALLNLREEVGKDSGLSPEDREFINERIGTYLADLGREAGDPEEWMDDDEGGDAGGVPE